MEDRLSMIIKKKTNRAVLMDIVLEKITEVHDKEQVKQWADCNRACESGLNILTQAELDRE